MRCQAFFLLALIQISSHVLGSAPGDPSNDTALTCPYINGPSCDNSTCCPYGTSCDQSSRSCVNFNTIPLFQWKTESPVPLAPKPQLRSQGPLHRSSRCPNTATYCKDAYRNGHTCCPVQNGTCCDDFLHCCPRGTFCDTYQGLCISGDSSGQPWFRVYRASKPKPLKSYSLDRRPPALTTKGPSCSDPVGKTCPDNSTCSDLATCCSTGDEEYGCCPMNNAVCCSDHLHCCPHGTVCNVAEGTCERPRSPWNRRSPLVAVRGPRVKVECPGGRFTCPDWTTCCNVGGGRYACCPMFNAVCCSDNRHCCPEGSACDVPDHRCVRGVMSTPLFKRIAACPNSRNPLYGNEIE